MEKKPAARLTVVVEFEDYPDTSDLKDEIERLEGYGTIKRAELEILTPNIINLG